MLYFFLYNNCDIKRKRYGLNKFIMLKKFDENEKKT